MPNMENVIKGLEFHINRYCGGREEGLCPYWSQEDCVNGLASDALALLKEQELPTELKQKMWNEFYSKEDEYEKHYIEAQKAREWFSTYRPWMQLGFNIAIDVIAEWEGR